jgi:hypothetical protein
MNVEFEYCYRDWGNFKRFGAVIFENRNQLAVDEIRRRVLRASCEGQWFNATHVRLPELYFPNCPFDPDLDHEFHEFRSASETELVADDSHNRDILDFLSEMEGSVYARQQLGAVL